LDIFDGDQAEVIPCVKDPDFLLGPRPVSWRKDYFPNRLLVSCLKHNNPTAWFDLNTQAPVGLKPCRQEGVDGQGDVTFDQGPPEKHFTWPPRHIEIDTRDDRKWDFIHNTPIDPHTKAFFLVFFLKFFSSGLSSQQEGALGIKTGEIDGLVVDGKGDQSGVRWNEQGFWEVVPLKCTAHRVTSHREIDGRPSIALGDKGRLIIDPNLLRPVLCTARQRGPAFSGHEPGKSESSPLIS